MGDGRRTPKEKIKIELKKHAFGWIYKMEADCFPVSLGTENKPDLP